MKTLLNRIMNWILDRLWLRHERSVFCGSGLKERAADLDFARRQDGTLSEEQIDRMARDLILDGTASTHAAEPIPELPDDWAERMKRLIEALKPKTDELLALIIVTVETMPGSMLKCRYKGKWHALIHPNDWEQVMKSVASRPDDAPVSPLWGIPVIHDDKLARAVLAGAISETI